MKIKTKIFLLFNLLLGLLVTTSFVSADLLNVQGEVATSSGSAATGNIRFLIYDNLTAGTLIYNSSDDFNGSIVDGEYDLLLGSNTSLDLIYGEIYYLEILINGEDLDFNGAERQIFEADLGSFEDTDIDGYLNVSGDIISNNFEAKSNTDYRTYVGVDVGGEVDVMGSPFEPVEISAVGYEAAHSNQGDALVALGYRASFENTGDGQVAIGSGAGLQNQGNNQVAVGRTAGILNAGNYQTAVGYNSGERNSGNNVVSLGASSGFLNYGDNSVFLGYASGHSNLGDRVIGLGYGSADSNSGDDVVAIGYQSGAYNSLNNQFILKQNNINVIPLIQGDFVTGNVAIGQLVAGEKLFVNGSINVSSGEDICITGGNCLSAVSGGNVTYSGGWTNNSENTTTNLNVLNYGGALLFNGTTGTTPTNGAGTRFMWIPHHSALRAGGVSGTQWDDSQIGNFTIGLGWGAIANRTSNVAIGESTISTGDKSVVLGSFSTASGTGSIALGWYNRATGIRSFASGYDSDSEGDTSIALGSGVNASGLSSTAMGSGTTASGAFGFAIGYGNIASGDTSTALGYLTNAIGDYSTSMGFNTNASGQYSTAFGRGIEAGGVNSVAIGLDDMNGLNVSDDNTMAIMGGQVGINESSPNATLHVNGLMMITPTDSPGTCAAGTKGAFYMDDSLSLPCYCDGSDWVEFQNASATC